MREEDNVQFILLFLISNTLAVCLYVYPHAHLIKIDIAKMNITLLCPQIDFNHSCVILFSFPCVLSLLCVGKSRLPKKGVEDGESLMSSLIKIPPLNQLRQSSFTLGKLEEQTPSRAVSILKKRPSCLSNT